LSIIDGNSALGTVLTGTNIHRRYTVVGSVRRILEVQDSSPVVGKVLGHLAGGAGGPRADVAFHGGIEGIAADNMVQMSTWQGAWLASRVKALEGKSRAWETKAGLSQRDECQCGGKRLHLCCGLERRSRTGDTLTYVVEE